MKDRIFSVLGLQDHSDSLVFRSIKTKLIDALRDIIIKSVTITEHSRSKKMKFRDVIYGLYCSFVTSKLKREYTVLDNPDKNISISNDLKDNKDLGDISEINFDDICEIYHNLVDLESIKENLIFNESIKLSSVSNSISNSSNISNEEIQIDNNNNRDDGTVRRFSKVLFSIGNNINDDNGDTNNISCNGNENNDKSGIDDDDSSDEDYVQIERSDLILEKNFILHVNPFLSSYQCSPASITNHRNISTFRSITSLSSLPYVLLVVSEIFSQLDIVKLISIFI